MTPKDRPTAFSDEALAQLFAPLAGASKVLAAVSGGPDSMALMHLLARWGRVPIIVATVDHGLRPESAQEAAFVAREAARLNLPHRILTWTGAKPKTGLQEAARKARYRLLAALAREEGASHLVTAHNQDDQAETVLMRLARGSGLAGLAAMRPETRREGIRLVRPLLGLPKSALAGLCREEAWPFAEDPSNRDERFARVRFRHILSELAKEGLTPERLARFSERALRAEEALEAVARKTYARILMAGPGGEGLRLNAAFLTDEPFEIALRVLLRGVLQVRGEVRGESGHIRLERLERTVERLREAFRAGKGERSTLAGVLLSLRRDGTLSLAPEPLRRRGR